MLIKWLSDTRNLRTRPDTFEKEYGEVNTIPCCRMCTIGQSLRHALHQQRNRSTPLINTFHASGTPFFRQKERTFSNLWVFSVFYSPLPLCLFFPMNLHFCLYRMDLLTTLLMPTCTLKSDNHYAFILICSSYHIRDIKKILASVFICAPVHSCQSICYLLL